MSGQLHAPATSRLWKEPAVPIDQGPVLDPIAGMDSVE
jgi:hypothetical protein